MRTRYITVAIAILACVHPPRPFVAAAADPARIHAVMPVPAELKFGERRLPVTSAFVVGVAGHDDARLRAGIARALRRGEERMGITLPRTESGAYLLSSGAAPTPTLRIECASAGPAVPALGEDESYSLEIKPTHALLRAPNVTGVLRGLETLLQLLQSDGDGWFLPAVEIRDRPRFPWRGLLIDVVRHWMPPEVIQRNIDAMAVVKLNVLHLHLTDDQGFRYESRQFSRLHELASDGLYYTQEQIRELVAYAAARGIRIMPEIELPGHATAFAVAYPEFVSAPGPYALQRRWGVFDAVLDPTNEKLYPFLDALFAELATLFPDAYVHIGGDENNGKQWTATPAIQAFIRQHDLKDNAGLQAYFNRRISALLAKHGKHLVGWGEILHPDLPRDSVVHAWGPTKSAVDAARQGFFGIRSTSYYLDHGLPAREHYLADPLPLDAELGNDAARRVLGAEACMWAEWVTAETIDSRIWPRAAAIAERLWSPRDVTDVPDMYRRLQIVSRWLEEAGSLHVKNPAAMLRRFAGNATVEHVAQLEALAALVNAGGLGLRNRASERRFTQFTPLTFFADCAVPETETGRRFAADIETLLFGDRPRDRSLIEQLQREIARWPAIADAAVDQAAHSSRGAELAPLGGALEVAHTIARDGLSILREDASPSEGWAARHLESLDAAARQINNGVTLSVLAPLRLLVAGIDAERQRTAVPAAEWRARVEKAATPAPAVRKASTP